MFGGGIICGTDWKSLGCYLVFFHPAAWLVRRHLRRDRELVCDEASGRSLRCMSPRLCGLPDSLGNLAAFRRRVRWPDRFSFLAIFTFHKGSRDGIATQIAVFREQKEPRVACFAAASIILAIRLVPEATFTPTSSTIVVPPRTADLIPESPQFSLHRSRMLSRGVPYKDTNRRFQKPRFSTYSSGQLLPRRKSRVASPRSRVHYNRKPSPTQNDVQLYCVSSPRLAVGQFARLRWASPRSDLIVPAIGVRTSHPDSSRPRRRSWAPAKLHILNHPIAAIC